MPHDNNNPNCPLNDAATTILIRNRGQLPEFCTCPDEVPSIVREIINRIEKRKLLMNLRELFDKILSTDISEIGITVKEEKAATIQLGNTTIEIKVEDLDDRFHLTVEEK